MTKTGVDLEALVALFAPPATLEELLNPPNGQAVERLIAMEKLEEALKATPPGTLISGHASGEKMRPLALLISHMRWESSIHVQAAIGVLIGCLGTQADIDKVCGYNNPGTPYCLVWDNVLSTLVGLNRTDVSLPHRRFPLYAA